MFLLSSWQFEQFSTQFIVFLQIYISGAGGRVWAFLWRVSGSFMVVHPGGLSRTLFRVSLTGPSRGSFRGTFHRGSFEGSLRGCFTVVLQGYPGKESFSRVFQGGCCRGVLIHQYGPTSVHCVMCSSPPARSQYQIGSHALHTSHCPTHDL